MTISSTTNRVSYTGNGVTTAFAFGYKFLANADLKVYQAGTLKTITTHYTVTGAGDDAGGTVTFLSAPANGESVVILRDPAITQGLDLVENDPLPAEDVEDEFDKLTMIAQRLDDRIDRAAVISDTVTDTIDPTLPAASARKAIVWNATADGFENSTYDPDQAQTDSAASAAASAASASAAATSAANAATAETNAEAAETNAEAAQAAAEAAQAAAEATASSIQGNIQIQTATRFSAGGTANAITGTLSPAISSYVAGLRVTTTPSGANTVTGPTINLNGLGTKTIKKRDSGSTKVALVAGDYNESGPFNFEYDGTDFILIDPIVSATSSQHGQCRLTKSGANLLLSPFNGNKLIINGTAQTIPSAGVTLAAPATTLTLYYIYAYMSGSTMTLEASTTGHATDSTTGVEIKSGDATRTLVGMARTVSSAWVDSATQRFVLSYFNRRPIAAINVFGANQSTTSGTFTEVGSSYKAEFLTWGNSAPQIGGGCSAAHDTASWTTNYFSVGVDGVSPTGSYTQFSIGGVGVYSSAAIVYAWPPSSEGYHYLSVLGATSTGTVTYQLNYTNFSAMVQG